MFSLIFCRFSLVFSGFFYVSFVYRKFGENLKIIVYLCQKLKKDGKVYSPPGQRGQTMKFSIGVSFKFWNHMRKSELTFRQGCMIAHMKCLVILYLQKKTVCRGALLTPSPEVRGPSQGPFTLLVCLLPR